MTFNDYMQEFGWSERDACAILGIGRNTYYVFKKGERTPPDALMLLLQILSDYPVIRSNIKEARCRNR